MHELVLVYGYHTGQSEGAALFAYFQKAGIAYRALTQADCRQKIASLVAETVADPSSYTYVPGAAATEYLPAEGEDAVLLFCYFTKDRLGAVLQSLKKNGAASLPLKAALTENNSQWTFVDLGVELGIEHRFMHFYLQLRRSLEMVKALDETSYTPVSWAKLQAAEAETESFLTRVGKEEIPPEEVEMKLSVLLNAYFSLVTTGEEGSP